jgi:hypothetical protein
MRDVKGPAAATDGAGASAADVGANLAAAKKFSFTAPRRACPRAVEPAAVKHDSSRGL